jgi:hypothetical protein
MCLVICGTVAVPSLKFRSCRAISSALSIHFEPSGSSLLTRSITASFVAIPRREVSQFALVSRYSRSEEQPAEAVRTAG